MNQDSSIRKTRKRVDINTLRTIRNMKQNGQCAQHIAQAVDLSLSTVYSTLEKLEKLLDESGKDDLNMILKKPGRKPSNNNLLNDKIRKILSSDNSLTQSGIQEKLKQDNIHITQARISQIISNIQFSRKRLKRVSEKVITKDMINERYHYSVRINSLTNENILYLDESGFNLHATNNYGYSPINVDAIRHVPANKGRNVSLLALISKTKFEKWQIINGAYDSQMLLDFLKNCIEQNIITQSNYIIMDNARIHHSRVVMDLLHEKNINYIFLPPYSPKLNPIEECFSMLKARYHHLRPHATTSEEIKTMVSRCIAEINSDKSIVFEEFYKHMRTYVDHGMKRNNFN